MHFSLPGLMSLLALVNPASSALWRVSFAIASIGGAIVLITVRGSASGKLGLTAYLLAIALYALIGLLAIAPGIVGSVGIDAAPVRVEAVLLTVLVFAGVNVAWLLLVEEVPAARATLAEGVRRSQAGLWNRSGSRLSGQPYGAHGPSEASPGTRAFTLVEPQQGWARATAASLCHCRQPVDQRQGRRLLALEQVRGLELDGFGLAPGGEDRRFVLGHLLIDVQRCAQQRAKRRQGAQLEAGKVP